MWLNVSDSYCMFKRIQFEVELQNSKDIITVNR